MERFCSCREKHAVPNLMNVKILLFESTKCHLRKCLEESACEGLRSEVGD